MARLTKPQTKLHDEAEALLSLSRPLTHEEIENVFAWWSPMANHNVSKNAVFFTPTDLAYEVALCASMSDGGARYLDMCAGIGRLTYAMMQHNRWESKRSEYVCVEFNPDFVAIGRKLVPQATWVCGSAFDLPLLRTLGKFTRGYSNPPFGNIPTKQDCDWLSFTGPADLMVAEVMVRLCEYGAAMILPRFSVPYDGRGNKTNSNLSVKWEAALPGYGIYNSSPTIDTSIYKDQWQGTSPAVEIAEVGEECFEQGALGLPGMPTLF